VTKNQVLNDEFQKQRWALLAHNQAITALAQARSERELVTEVCKAITSQEPYVLAWVGAADNDANQSIRFLGSSGSEEKYLSNIPISWSAETVFGKGPGGTSIRTGALVVITDTRTDTTYAPWRERAIQHNINSVIGVPIFNAENQTIGSLLVYSKVIDAFGEFERKLFENFAKEVGFGLDALKKQRMLQEVIEKKAIVEEKLTCALRATIESMSKTMEWRDPYTAGHQKRVATIAAAIARVLGWDEEQIQSIYLAGLVHDIGKIAVPSEILTKPSRLTPIEMQLVQGHAETSYQILKDIPFPWPLADMVHQHHERLDGSGYPLKLKGDQICMGARILAVADTIEAMATHRPYRAALGLDLAMKTIRANAGIGLDPIVVDAAFTLLDQSHTLQNLLEN
jgi:putative nucleotidyltransferase with HDIG domain